MKTIGLIGGMSWESSIEYYRIINEEVYKKLGKSHSCSCIMYSVDFEPIKKLQHKNKWEELTDIMIKISQNLENSGADFIVICTNTMHIMAEDIEKSINIPIFHLVDAVADRIQNKKIKKVGLLGTKFTMEQNFYKKRLKKVHNIDVIIPNEDERDIIHSVIYNELINGKIKEESKQMYKIIIENLQKNGAEGVILGCTEIPLLIKQKDSEIPVFDTSTIHAKKAVEFALE